MSGWVLEWQKTVKSLQVQMSGLKAAERSVSAFAALNTSTGIVCYITDYFWSSCETVHRFRKGQNMTEPRERKIFSKYVKTQTPVSIKKGRTHSMITFYVVLLSLTKWEVQTTCEHPFLWPFICLSSQNKHGCVCVCALHVYVLGRNIFLCGLFNDRKKQVFF